MENKLRTPSVGGEGVDRIGTLGLTYIHYHVYKRLLMSIYRELDSVLCGDLNGKNIKKRGEIYITDSL